MKKIKEYIIHKLGGYTQKEIDCKIALGRYVSQCAAFIVIKSEMDSYNGMDADEWCKKSYNFVSESVENYKKLIDKIESYG